MLVEFILIKNIKFYIIDQDPVHTLDTITKTYMFNLFEFFDK